MFTSNIFQKWMVSFEFLQIELGGYPRQVSLYWDNNSKAAGAWCNRSVLLASITCPSEDNWELCSTPSHLGRWCFCHLQSCSLPWQEKGTIGDNSKLNFSFLKISSQMTPVTSHISLIKASHKDINVFHVMRTEKCNFIVWPGEEILVTNYRSKTNQWEGWMIDFCLFLLLFVIPFIIIIMGNLHWLMWSQLKVIYPL